MKSQRFDDAFTPQSAWLDLVNSQQWDGFGRLTDHLLEPRWVARFLRYWTAHPEGLLRTMPGKGLVALRSQLRQSAEGIASGVALKRQDVAAFNAILGAARHHLHLIVKGKQAQIELRPVRSDWTWVKSRIVASFLETLQGHPDRVKICANPGCRWAFVDKTKANTRRWCYDRRCGNRDRVRRARARRVKGRLHDRIIADVVMPHAGRRGVGLRD